MHALHHCSVEMNLIYDPFQCISTIAFVKNEGEVLDSPIWIMLINIVALEMLGAKMPKPTGIGISILVIIQALRQECGWLC